jgi:hypothetical protein
MNRKLRASQCSHVLKYRGHGERVTQKRVEPRGKRKETQRVVSLYTEFARYGDLYQVIQAHAANET